MPLAAMWPMGIQSPGREINDMVSFVDFVPTFLEMAGISAKTSGMEPSPGRSLMEIFQSSKEGQVIPERTSVVIGKERHDYSRPNNQGYPIRGIVENGYLYLYNYHIDRWPTGNPEIGYLDCDGSPTKTEILNMNRKGKGRSFWQGSFGKRQQHEELYDISKDPECMNNLIHQEKLGPLKRAMKAKMEKQLKAEEDPRMFGKGEIFNTYGFSVPHGKNYFERFMDGEFKTFKTRWINPSDLETEPME
jgi:arylsulfatase A-like enzyme